MNKLKLRRETAAVSECIYSAPAKSQARENVNKYAYLASPDEIQGNDFNLNIPRYVDTFEEGNVIDLDAVRQERNKLKAKLDELEKEMEGYLKELGYDT